MDTGVRSLDCSTATITRDKHEHGVAKQSRAHEHPAAAAAAAAAAAPPAPRGIRATLASSSTRAPVDAVVLLLRTARAC